MQTSSSLQTSNRESRENVALTRLQAYMYA